MRNYMVTLSLFIDLFRKSHIPDTRRPQVVTGIPELMEIILDITIRLTKILNFTLGKNHANVCFYVLCL
jgi:hypothetical protein